MSETDISPELGNNIIGLLAHNIDWYVNGFNDF